MQTIEGYCLFKAEFGSSPVTALEVVLDGVVRLHPDPVGHLAVLLDLLAQSFLQLVAFVGSLLILPFLDDFINHRL